MKKMQENYRPMGFMNAGEKFCKNFSKSNPTIFMKDNIS